MLATTLMRGDESTRLNLAALSVHRNHVATPLSMESVQIDIQWAKDNRGDKVDMRLVPYHKKIHMCPLVHMALHFWARLNPPSGPAPFKWADLISGAW